MVPTDGRCARGTSFFVARLSARIHRRRIFLWPLTAPAPDTTLHWPKYRAGQGARQRCRASTPRRQGKPLSKVEGSAPHQAPPPLPTGVVPLHSAIPPTFARSPAVQMKRMEAAAGRSLAGGKPRYLSRREAGVPQQEGSRRPRSVA
eukprot:gene10636-biopygen13861